MQPTRELQTFEAGALVFRYGDAGDCAYLIERGRIDILAAPGADGAGGKVLASLSPGDVFGEMSLLDGQPRSAAARAASDCVLLPITRGLMERRLTHADPFTRLLLKLVLNRFRGTQAVVAGQEVTPPLEHQNTLRQVAAELTLASDLRGAVEQDRLEVHYQPILGLADARIAGFEALVRWDRAGAGYVSPSEFISVAEDTGLILALGRWVLERAAAALPRLQAALPADSMRGAPFMSVNVSAGQLYEDGEVARLLGLIDAAGVAPGQVKLEITETVLLRDPQRAALAMHALRDAGVRLAIDDFGTGYSSLSYLHRYPLDTLKIDRSFVAALDQPGRAPGLVRTVLALCRELELQCVAEGIETRAQCDRLREYGCELGQGYLFARPQAESALTDWMQGPGVPASPSK